MTLPPKPEVPHDLWSRLARLSQTCHVDTVSEYVKLESGEPQRVWRITIHPPPSAKPGETPVTAQDASAARAITAAIQQAETRGWNC